MQDLLLINWYKLMELAIINIGDHHWWSRVGGGAKIGGGRWERGGSTREGESEGEKNHSHPIVPQKKLINKSDLMNERNDFENVQDYIRYSI